MTEEQCTRMYDALAELLRQSGLHWVMEQVDAEVRLGKLVDRSIREIRSTAYTPLAGFELVEGVSTRGRTSASIKQRIDFRASERLRILIQAIEHAVQHAAQIAENTLESLSKTHSLTHIAFEPDGSNERSFRIDRAGMSSGAPARETLQHALDQIKEQIDAP